jgi:uncharacterized LabA/DUF88 family protein
VYNIYVDGESHFLRTEACFKDVAGGHAQLEDVTPDQNFGEAHLYPRGPVRFRLERRAMFFWDATFPRFMGYHFHDNRIGRAVYFTSSVGGDEELHEVRTSIRKHGFEPLVIREHKKLADQRTNLRKSEGVIERAKGVDISIAVRMLEDAYANTFDDCLLFTSDVDYMPAIRAVRRMGKQVVVLGYEEGLGKNSALEFEPDAFYDLGDIVRQEYRLKSPNAHTG